MKFEKKLKIKNREFSFLNEKKNPQSSLLGLRETKGNTNVWL